MRIGQLSEGHPALLGPPADTTLRTDAAGLEAGAVWVPVADGELPAYRARPSGAGPFPVVLVVQEVFGANEYLQDTCRRLARHGLCAISPELYARQGDPFAVKSREELFALVGSVPDAQVLADLDACADWAEGTGEGEAARLAITGFCWGGRIAWLYAAHSARLRCAVAWYGRLVGDTDERHPRHAVDVAGELRAPVLGLYGGKDEGIPQDSVERMKAALAEANDPSEFVIYPDAPHAFHADYRTSYRAAPAEDGFGRLLGWLAKHGIETRDVRNP